MKWILLLCTLLTCGTTIYCVKELKPHRYSLSTTERLITYRIDHKSGMVWHISEKEAVEVHDPWLRARVLTGDVDLD